MLENYYPVPLAVVVDVAIVSELNKLGLVEPEIHHPEFLGPPQIPYQAVYVLRGHGFVHAVDVVAQNASTGASTDDFEVHFGGVGVLVLVTQTRFFHHHPAALLARARVHVQAVSYPSQIGMLCVGGFDLCELACAGPA